MKATSINRPLASVLALGLMAGGALNAATMYKANNADALNLGSSWNSGVAPGATDIAQFDTSIIGLGTNVYSLGADTTWMQLRVDRGTATAGGLEVFNAGNLLTLTNARATANIGTTTGYTTESGILLNSGTGAGLTLNCNIKLAPTTNSSALWTSSRALTINGNVDLGVNTLDYYQASGSSGTIGGVVSGTGGLTTVSSGNLTLTNVNTYSGGTRILNGNLYVTSTNGLGSGLVNLPASAGKLYVNPASVGATSALNALRTRRDVLLGNSVLLDVTSGSVGLNTAGGFWIQPSGTGTAGRLTSSSGTLSLASVDVNGVPTTGNLTTLDHQIQVAIPDFGATPVAVVKSGANSLTLNQSNSFSGGLTVNGGRLNAGNVYALGKGTVTVNSGGQVYLTVGSATYSNNFNLNGNGITETAGTLGALRFGNGNAVAGTVTAVSNARIHAQDGNATLSGSLAGAANVEKTGASQLTLSGASPAFTGTFTHAAGPLVFSGSLAGNLTVNDGLTLSGKGTVGGLLTLGSSTGAVLRVQGNIPGALTAAGGLTLNGVTALQIDSVPGVAGPFPVINYGGTLSGSTANFSIAGASQFRVAPVLADTGSAITLNLPSGLPLTWTGSSGSAWDIATTTNWTDGTNPQNFMQMDSVTFDDSSAVGTVTITGLVRPASVLFNNSATTYALSGAAGNGIIGSAYLTKNNAGTVTLGGSNDFAGTISVNAGVLKMGSALAFGRSSGITIANGATVDINGQTPGNVATGGYSYTIQGNGADGNGALVDTGADAYSNAGVKNLSLAADASVGGTGRFDLGYANTAGYGVLNGNGHTLTKLGANPMSFRGDASGSRIDIVANGGLIWVEDNDKAFGGTNGTVTVNSGASAGTYGARTVATPVTLNAGGKLNNQGGGRGTWSGTITANDGAILSPDNGEIAIAGTLNAPGSLDKTGANQLTLLGAANITGDIDVQAGTLQVGDVGPLGSLGNPGSITLTASADGTPVLRYRLSGADATLASPVTFVGEFSELRHHPGTATNTLTLTGTVGTDATKGVLDAETGKIILGSAASVTLNRVTLKGSATAVDRGTLEIPAGASLTARYMNIGGGSSQSGVINQGGGTVTLVPGSNGIRVGHWNNNSATVGSEYNLTGGTFDATGLAANTAGVEGEKVVNVGWDGYGVMNVGGGTGVATLKAAGIRYDRQRTTSAYPSMMSINPNGVVELGNLGLAGAGSTKTLMNGGQLTCTTNATLSAPLSLAAATTSSLAVAGGMTATLSGVLSGNGTLSKTGNGTLLLSSVSAATNALTVSAGTLTGLTGTSSSNSAVTVLSGATLSVQLAGLNGQWSCGGAAFAGASTLDINYGGFAPSTNAAPLLVNGDLALNGPLNISVRGNVTTVGTYPLVQYTGSLSGTPPTAPANLPPGLVALIVNNTANKSLDLQVTVGAQLTWRVGNGEWDINTTANWKDAGGNSVNYLDGQPAVFDDSASGASPILVALNTTVAPAAVIATNATKDYVLSGPGAISGFASLLKQEAARLTLVGSHTYSGGTTISAGTLQLGDGTTGNGVVSGAIVDNGALEFANPLDQTNSGAISGSGSVAKSAAGILALTTKLNTFAGDLTVGAGTLVASAVAGSTETNSALGLKAPSRSIIVNSNATLLFTVNNIFGGGGMSATNLPTVAVSGTLDATRFNVLPNLTLNGGTLTQSSSDSGSYEGYQFIGAISVRGSGPSTISSPTGKANHLFNGTTTFDVAEVTGSVEADLVVSNPLKDGSGDYSGVGSLVKTGPGTMLLSAANTYTGTTTVSNGTLQVDGSLAAGGSVHVAGGTLNGLGIISGPVSVQAGGTLKAGSTNLGTLTINGALSFSAGATNVMRIDKQYGSVLGDQLYGMAGVTYGGTLKVLASGEALMAGDSVTLFTVLSGGYAGGFSQYDLPALSAGLTWDVSGLTTSGALRVVTGVAQPVFNPPAGNYVGAQSVTISSDAGATIYYTTDGSDPASSPTRRSGTSPVTGVLVPLNVVNYQLMAYATKAGSGDSPVATALYSTVAVPTYTSLYGGGWAYAYFWSNGVIANGSGMTADFSTLSLPADTTVTLDGAVTAGHLIFADAANIFNWTLADGGVGGLTLDGGTNSPTITVSNRTTTVGAAVAGANGLIKDGAGTLAFSSQKTYTGGTTVNQGVLDLIGGGGAGGTIRGAVTVNSGATLRLSTGDATGYGTGADRLATINLTGGTLDVSSSQNQTLGSAVINLTGGAITGVTNGNLDFYAGASALHTFASATPSTISGVALSPLRQGSTTFTVEDGPALVDLEIASVLRTSPSGDASGAALIKAGAGTLKLTGLSTYSRSTVVSNGVLDLTSGSLYSAAYDNSSVVTVHPGATLRLGNFGWGQPTGLGQLADYAQRRVLNGGTLEVTGSTHNSGNDFTVTTNGGSFLYSAAGQTLTLNGNGNGDIQVNGPLSIGGAGNLVVNETVAGNGRLTKVGAGRLQLNDSFPSSVSGGVFVAAGTLGGSGTIAGSVTVDGGARLAPGDSSGLGLMLINGSLLLNDNSTTTVAIDRSAGTSSYGRVTGLAAVTYGGTLVVTNLGGTFQSGDRFTLFSAATHQGAFGSFSLPEPPAGTTWQFSAGVLSLVGGTPPLPTTPTNIAVAVSSSGLNLSWPASYTGWVLLEQTNNLSLGVSTNYADWAPVAGSGSTNQVSLPVDQSRRSSFYRLVRPVAP